MLLPFIFARQENQFGAVELPVQLPCNHLHSVFQNISCVSLCTNFISIVYHTCPPCPVFIRYPFLLLPFRCRRHCHRCHDHWPTYQMLDLSSESHGLRPVFSTKAKLVSFIIRKSVNVLDPKAEHGMWALGTQYQIPPILFEQNGKESVKI